MRAKARLEGLNRVAEDVTHPDIGRGRARRAPRNALVHGVGLARIAQPRLQQRHVLVAVIFVIEARARRVRIHNAYLDHGGLPVSAGWSPALIETLRQFCRSCNSERMRSRRCLRSWQRQGAPLPL